MDFFSVSVQLNLFLGVPVERVTALHKRAAKRGLRSLILGRVHRVAVHSFDDCNDDRSTGTQRAVPLRLGPQVQTLLPREGQRRSERRTEGGGGSGSTIFRRIRDTGRGHNKNGTIAKASEPSAVEGGG